MYWFFILILIIVITILSVLYNIEKNKNKEIEKINIEKRKENKQIDIDNQNLKIKNEKLLARQKGLNSYYEQKQEDLNKIQETINSANEVSKKSFENYNKLLDKEYKAKEKEFDKSIKILEQSYDDKQDELLAEIGKIRGELDKITATKAAAIKAQLKEQEIQNQQEYYSLSISDVDKREVKILQSVEPELRDPRPVRMIIWTTYYSKKANELAARVLGTKDICGIYKITNKETKLCYIGQAKDVRERFREHMKCGLGIDTPANNKLYDAMKKDGLENFTFELLEECPAAALNEKEAFYINLYSSKDYGYNSNKGVQK